MMYKSLLCLSLLLTPAVQAAVTQYADVLFTHLTPNAKVSSWLRANPHTPKYPLELAQNGIHGCGVFKVRVDAEGKTAAVELVRAVPKKGLHRSAVKLLKGWKWLPNPDVVKTGADQGTLVQATSEQSMLVRLDFCMGGQSLEEAAARCQVQAQYACQE